MLMYDTDDRHDRWHTCTEYIHTYNPHFPARCEYQPSQRSLYIRWHSLTAAKYALTNALVMLQNFGRTAHRSSCGF